MFPNQCDDCFAEQEELLERNPGGCGQVVCWCYTEEDLVRQDEKERNWVEMPDDDDLETAMMILGEEEMDDDKLVIVEDSSSVDGFERELLANYNSQDYVFAYNTDFDAACQEMENGDGQFLDWMELDISWDVAHEFL